MQMNGKASYVTTEEGRPQMSFAPGTGAGGDRSKWTRLEFLLAGICVLLSTIILVLVVILAAQNIHLGNASANGNFGKSSASSQLGMDQTAVFTAPVGVTPGSHLSQDEKYVHRGNGASASQTALAKKTEKDVDVCLTAGCVKAAARILTAMDQTVNPCDDFFEFACGNWNKINIIPDDRALYNTFSKLADDILGILKDLLEAPITKKDSKATQNSKKLYASCVNETLIDLQGLEPIKSLLRELGGWPVVMGNEWKEEDVDLIDLIVKLRLYNNKILIDQWVSADDKNSKVNIIQLDQPDLGMESPDYYIKPAEGELLQVYEKLARDVAIIFGANETRAKQEVHDLVQLEVKLANITVPETERRDSEKMYNRMTVKELQKMIPGFDWLLYLQKMFKFVGIEINENEEVVVYSPDYLKKMVDLILQTDKRTLVNYMIWRIMMNRIPNLPREYRAIKNEYSKKMFGSETERARWKECVEYVKENLGNPVGRMFIEENFDETSKTTALEMIHNIRDAFYDLLKEADWMDQPTQLVAREKAEAVTEKIGYSDSILNDTALNEEFQDVTYSPDHYFENVLANIRHITVTNLKRLRDPVDRTKWSTTPAVVNAFYSSAKNQIMFPAAILQPPFYSKEYPKSLNYGGIGMVIGHEITHGFDDRGRQFDKDGNLIQWWDDIVIQKFKERAQCIIDQYNNYTVPGLNINVNGILTQGENIADNGGIKEAYKAYRKWVADRGSEEPRLPGMEDYDNNQLFFINFAQVWCGTMRPEASINRIRTSVHSPGRYRVIGTLQNLDAFSEAFKCKANSYMNPPHKCSVW